MTLAYCSEWSCWSQWMFHKHHCMTHTHQVPTGMGLRRASLCLEDCPPTTCSRLPRQQLDEAFKNWPHTVNITVRKTLPSLRVLFESASKELQRLLCTAMSRELLMETERMAQWWQDDTDKCRVNSEHTPKETMCDDRSTSNMWHDICCIYQGVILKRFPLFL